MKNDVAMILANLGQLAVQAKEKGDSLEVIMSADSKHTSIDIRIFFESETEGVCSKIIYCDDELSQSVYKKPWLEYAELVVMTLSLLVTRGRDHA